MDFVSSLALLISGGLIVGSLILSRIGIERSVLSCKNASIITGIGSGIGAGLFIYFGVSHHDLGGSIFVGLVSAFTLGLTIFLMSKKNFR